MGQQCLRPGELVLVAAQGPSVVDDKPNSSGGGSDARHNLGVAKSAE